MKKQTIKASDLEKYIHYIYCTVGGGEPFYNQVVIVKPSHCGTKVNIMLDSHNFDSFDLDEHIEVYTKDQESDYDEHILKHRSKNRLEFLNILEAANKYP